MGTWGEDAFSNDYAAAWLDRLHRGEVSVDGTLERAGELGALKDERRAHEALAAVEVIACSMGKGPAELPESVDIPHDIEVTSSARGQALAIAERLAADGSTLSVIWEGDAKWSNYMVGLQQRLGSISPVKPPVVHGLKKRPPELYWLLEPSLVFASKFSAIQGAFFRIIPRLEKALGLSLNQWAEYRRETLEQDADLAAFWLKVFESASLRCVEIGTFPKHPIGSYHYDHWAKRFEDLGRLDLIPVIEELRGVDSFHCTRDYWVNGFSASGIVFTRAQKLAEVGRLTISFADALEETVQIIEHRHPIDVAHSYADVSAIAFWRIFCEFAVCDEEAAALALDRSRVLAWERELASDFAERTHFPDGMRDALVEETAELIKKLKAYAKYDWSSF